MLGILISTCRNKIGISVFQKEIPLSKMDIYVLQIDSSIKLKTDIYNKIKISVFEIHISLF